MKSLRAPVSHGLLIVAHALLAAAGCGCGATEVGPHPVPSADTVAVVVPVETATAAPTATAEAVCVDPPGPRPTVLNVMDPPSWPERDLLAGAADKGAGVEKACKKIEGRKAPAMKKAPDAGDSELESLGKCFASPKGAWALDIDGAGKLLPDQYNDDEGWEVRYTLVYVTPEGKTVKADKLSGTVSFRIMEQNNAEALAVFDFDGDGVTEILLLQSRHVGGEEHDYKRSLYTFKDGKVVPYGPAEKLDIRAVVDVDADGRPDLLIHGPFTVIGPCGLDGEEFTGPLQVAHSLPGGTFSIDDAVAKEAVRAQCGPMAKELVSVSRGREGTSVDSQETAKRITCARIYGMTDREAAQRIRERYPFPHKKDDSEDVDPGAAGYCMPLKLMVDLAEQKPDFTTEAPCPPK